MKKIYMILAVFALLSMSLNAQVQTVDHSNNQLRSVQVKGVQAHHNNSSTNSKHSFINLLRSTKGMSTIMPQLYDGTPVQGLLRAPRSINSDEVTVGPFTGDNFDNGLGFGNAYSSPQEIFIETDLLRSEYADYIGEDIIGFRLALAGDATNTVQVGEFMAWPGNSDGSFDQDHLYTWSIGELTNPAGQPYDQYVRINSTSDLESGAEYLIVYETDNVAFNGGLTSLDVGNNVISVTRNNDVIQSNATTDAATFTITQSGNYYTIRSKSGYYIGRTSSNNGMNTSATTVYNNSITFNGNNATIRGRSSTGNNASNTYYLRFLNTSGTNNYRFRYYPTTSGQNIQLYKKVTVTPTAPAYVALQDGQWHEFYLDNPVPFVVGSDNATLSLGYTYIQYPTGTSGQNLFPIAVNSQSTTHNHYAYMTVESQGSGGAGDITITCQNCFQTSFYYIIVVDNATGDYLTYWAYNGATYTNGNGQTCWELPNGWSLDGAAYFYQETVSGYNLGYLSTNGPGSIVISSSAFGNNPNVSVLIAAAGWDDGYTVSVNGDAQTIESGTIADYEWNPVNFSGGGGGTTTNTGWYPQDFSQYGDLAVQLIFKSKLPKTDAPTITATDNGDGTYTITATATNPTATVTLTVGNEQPVSGTGSASYIVTQGNTAQTVTATATAQAPNELVSDPTTETFTIPGLPKTATPTITYVDNGDGTYTVTATGDGEVTLNVGGQTATGTGSASVVIVRSTEAQTVTATATAQETGKLESDPATRQITIPALTTDPTQMLEGLLRLHLMIVDQMKVDIPDDNSHPDRYGYVLRYEPNGANDTTGMKESSTVYVDIQKADCEVMGAYTLAQVDNDKHIGINHDQGIKMNVISADVEYDLSATNDLLYDYRLQGAENATPSYQSNYLSRLQKTQNFTYVEMEESNPNKGHEYPNGEYHYFVGEDNLKTGNYGSSYVSYAPSVSTWGIQRRYYEEDGYDNTYGAAIAKTGAGYVEMTADPKAELQTGKDGSTNWEYDGQACSLYILDNIKAEGKLPHSSVTTLSYEPYMFRVFVESKNGLLRHFQQVEGDGETTGEHCEGIAGDPYGPICVWSGYVVDDDEYGQAFDTRVEGDTIYMFQKMKVDRTEANGAWDQTEANAIFAAVDALAIEGYDTNGQPIEKDEIDSDDLNVFVRFYYIIKGSADDHEVQSGNDIVNGSRDGESSRPGNGAESPGKSPDPATGIYEIVFNGEVVSVTYVNALGMESDRPFDGVNIVVVRYSDGKVSTTKVVR